MHRHLTYDWETQSIATIPDPYTVIVRQDDGTTTKRLAVAMLHQARLDPRVDMARLWPEPVTRVVLGILDPATGHITPAEIAAVLGGTP